MTRGRYELPDPICLRKRHKRRGIVTAGSAQGAHAAVSVCDRSECIEDALLWARSSTGLHAYYRPDKRDAPPVLGQLEMFPEVST